MLSLLKCLLTTEAQYVLKEILEGVCGSHSRGSNVSSQSCKSRLLLAHDELRLIGDGQKVRQMSEVHKCSSKSSSRTQIGFVAMAICPMGGQHHRAHAPGKKGIANF
jgi:hypothetical protein